MWSAELVVSSLKAVELNPFLFLLTESGHALVKLAQHWPVLSTMRSHGEAIWLVYFRKNHAVSNSLQHFPSSLPTGREMSFMDSICCVRLKLHRCSWTPNPFNAGMLSGKTGTLYAIIQCSGAEKGKWDKVNIMRNKLSFEYHFSWIQLSVD